MKGGAHKWSGWPGAYCLRCGTGQVLEIAIAENWIKSFGTDEVRTDGTRPHPDKWKSKNHKKLVELCDGHCYADMTPAEVETHRWEIKALQDKLGV